MSPAAIEFNIFNENCIHLLTLIKKMGKMGYPPAALSLLFFLSLCKEIKTDNSFFFSFVTDSDSTNFHFYIQIFFPPGAF